jgi:hypothetical protein
MLPNSSALGSLYPPIYRENLWFNYPTAIIYLLLLRGLFPCFIRSNLLLKILLYNAVIASNFACFRWYWEKVLFDCQYSKKELAD